MLALSPVISNAQASLAPESGAAPARMHAPPPTPEGTVNCFDYYHFGSVQANISSSVARGVSGAPVTFTGVLVNQNAYPIVDGSLYVRIFKQRGDPGKKDVNGPDVVSQYEVRGGIALPAGGKMPLEISWDVPSYAQTGDYKIATYFTSAHKFNLLGLSFTDDVIGNSAEFGVMGELPAGVSFDKSAVSVAGKPYHFAAYPPAVGATSSVAVEAMIRNGTSRDEEVAVEWETYYWDAQLETNRIDHTRAMVKVAAGQRASATYTVNDTTYPVYLVVGTMRWGNTESIINVRFVREGKNRLRINFPSLTNFPLKAGASASVFSCLHNAGESARVPGGKLDLTLTDEYGRVVHRYEYAGDVTGAMMGVVDSFVPQWGYDKLTLDAKLYQGDELVDSARMTYDCAAINPKTCLPESEKAPEPGLFGLTASETRVVVDSAIVAGLILLFALFRLWRSRRKAPAASATPPQPRL